MNIRPVKPDDAASTADLLNAIIATGTETSMSEPLTAEEQLRYIKSFPARGVFLVAELPAPYGIVGMQSIEPCGEEQSPTGHVAEISTFVTAACRGRGVASALFNQLSSRASAIGIRKLSATIRADNQSAQAFYLSKAGFRLVGTMRDHLLYRGHYIDQLLAERLLSYGDA
jgi:L-amino acid N-acyltransferase YncA